MSKKQKRSASRLLAYLISFAMILVTFWSDYTLAFAADDEIETSIEQEELVEEDMPAVEEEPEVVSDDEAVIEEAGEEVISEETTGTEATEVIAEEEDADEVSEDNTEVAEDSEAVEETEGTDATEITDETETEEILETETEETFETETEETLETETETELVEYTLYFEATKGGFVTIEEQVLTEDDEVETVTAIAYSGYQFINWTKDGAEYSTSKSITPELEDATYVANFEVLPLEFSQSTVVNGIEISLYAAPGVLPNDAKLQVTALSANAEDEIQELIDGQTEEDVLATYSFDINIFSASEGGFVQPEDGTVAVTFEAIPEAGDEDTTVAVYHVDSSLSSAEQVSGETASDSITFDAEHFSIYTVTLKGKNHNGIISVRLVSTTYDGYWGNYPQIADYTEYKWDTNQNTLTADALMNHIKDKSGIGDYKFVAFGIYYGKFISEFKLDSGDKVQFKNMYTDNWEYLNGRTVYAFCRPDPAYTTANHLDLGFLADTFRTYADGKARVYAIIDGHEYDLKITSTYKDHYDGHDYYEYRLNGYNRSFRADDEIEFRVDFGGKTYRMPTTTELNNQAFERCFLSHLDNQDYFGFDYVCNFEKDFVPLSGDVLYKKNDGTDTGKTFNLTWTDENPEATQQYTILEYAAQELSLGDYTGHTFLGWSTDANAEKPDENYAPGKTISVKNKDCITLYAVWSKGSVKVAVYATDGTDSTVVNPQLKELLGLEYVQKDGYYPVGVISLPTDMFVGNSPYIHSDEDLRKVLEAIENIDTSAVVLKCNNQNTVANNLQYVQLDLNANAGSHKTALFTWSGGEAENKIVNPDGGNFKYHLDLRFATAKIDYKGVYYTDTTPDGSKDLTSVIRLADTALSVETATAVAQNYKSYNNDQYDLEGVYTDKDCTEEFTGIKELKRDVTLYAKYKKAGTYEVRYKGVFKDKNGNIVTEKTINTLFPTETRNTGVSDATDKEIPDKTGYIPDSEWEKSTEGVKVIYTATYTPIRYKVRYNKNLDAAEGEMADTEAYFDEAFDLAENKYAALGYTFLGWAKDPKGTKEYGDKAEVINLASTADAVVDLYAVWQDDRVDVAFFLLLPGLTVPSNSSGQPKENYYPANSAWTWVGKAITREDANKLLGIKIDERDNIYDDNAENGYDVHKCILSLPEEAINTYLKSKYGENVTVDKNVVWYVYKDADSSDKVNLHIDGYVKDVNTKVTYKPGFTGDAPADDVRITTTGIKYTVRTYENVFGSATKPHATFAGWKDESNASYKGDGKEYIDPLKNEKVFTAQWDMLPQVTIEYDAMGGQFAYNGDRTGYVSELKYTDEHPFTVEDPTMDHWHFVGWERVDIETDGWYTNPEVIEAISLEGLEEGYTVRFEARWSQKRVLQFEIDEDGEGDDEVMYDGEAHIYTPTVKAWIKDTVVADDLRPFAEGYVGAIGNAINELLSSGSLVAYADNLEARALGDITTEDGRYTIKGLTLSGGYGTNVGTYDLMLNTKGMTIFMGDENLTDEFEIPEIAQKIGALKITARPITITSASDTKVYDGTALRNAGYTIGGEGLVSADDLTVTVDGVQVIVGSGDNTFTYKFKDEVMAKNYNVTETTFGTLAVTPAPAGNDVRGGDDDDDNDGDDDDDRADEAGSVLGANRGVEATENEDQFEEAGQVLGAGRGKSPKTNDANNAVLWAMVMGTSALGIAAMMAQRRRREDEE
ncbi:MAG: InlB B-repeat-containing protein [Lachnospiraceae bacterium]|nr:InlB B-repeat-containing protein [Lachnospiraceae bacterium]